jgi:hypothetical protein
LFDSHNNSIFIQSVYKRTCIKSPVELEYTGCPRVGKKPHNLFVVKDINFFFFLDDSYASTAYSGNIAVYIQSGPIL